MVTATSSLAHMEFFEALAAADEGTADWRAISAGLVTLRLVDRWLTGEPDAARPRAWGLRAVRESVSAMEPSDPARAVLTGLLDAMAAAVRPSASLVAPRLMAYGRALDLRGLWRLAADVFSTVVGHVSPGGEPDMAIDANMKLGYALRMLSRLDEATEAYDRAGRIATASGDVMKVLRARVADAKIAMARGNFPSAEQILEDTIGEARQRELPQIVSIALHDRASVAHSRGQFDRAVRFAYEALETNETPSERDRILIDIATILMELGVYTAARDALLVLASTAQEQYLRWMATINLIELEALDGCEPQVERYRRELEEAPMPPSVSALYHLIVGQAQHALGHADASRASLQRALAVAEAHALHEITFKAERELEQLDRGEPTRPAIFSAPTEALSDIFTAMSDMRVAAGAA